MSRVQTSSGGAEAPQMRALLAEIGLRITPARVTVLDHLLHSRRALSHADLEADLAGQRIDRVTLYRTLDTLAEAGLLAKNIGRDRVARFVPIARGDHSHHAHFTCDQCGRLYCLPAKPPRAAGLPEGFQVASVDLKIHGRCADCVASA